MKEVIGLVKKNQNYLWVLILISFLVITGCSKKETTTEKQDMAGHSAVIINNNTYLRENPSADSKSLYKLERGDLVKILSKKVVGNDEWSRVELNHLSYPPPTGWVLSRDYTTDKSTIPPNQGFIREINVYAKPDPESAIIHEKSTGRVGIKKRENGWAYCIFPAGAEEGWVKESDISYEFPY